ncbi:MAG: 2OG-Fe dioxygenase family protein [Stagnimonas sp.]|nr:2OG-Fe dioxygenase family protein [Stagnimonas sp.]
MTALPATPVSGLLAGLSRDGHVRPLGGAMRALLEAAGPLTDWAAFADSWNRLELDRYMADGGRYRRRRHAVHAVSRRGIEMQPHQPHWQGLDYNPLNGGIERWFEPLEPAIAGSYSLHTVLSFCAGVFGALAPGVVDWKVEVHQFRIEAAAGEPGQPTPEGVHRDGVDYVLVLLVRRDNIASGTTTIHAPDGRSLGSFTLTEPFDAVLLDDSRVFHGVTPVQPLDPARPAYRDVLVVTFRRTA